MRKAARLFEIIEILRAAKRPITAERIAERLEVGLRSVYRDMAALQAMRVPIEGERGVGYILRPGFDLPPLMFNNEEIEAVLLGLALIERTGDGELTQAAATVAAKISAVVNARGRRALESQALRAWGPVAPTPSGADLVGPPPRAARRREAGADLSRRTEPGVAGRIVRPFALIYLPDGATLVAWCELRSAIRSFRVERILLCASTGDRFHRPGRPFAHAMGERVDARVILNPGQTRDPFFRAR